MHMCTNESESLQARAESESHQARATVNRIKWMSKARLAMWERDLALTEPLEAMYHAKMVNYVARARASHRTIMLLIRARKVLS